MRRRVLGMLVATGVAALGFSASASVTVFHSKDDDGVNPGATVVLPPLPPGTTHTLYLYLDNQGSASGAGASCSSDDTKICAYDLILEAESGVLFDTNSFASSIPGAVHSIGGTRLRVNAVAALNGTGLPSTAWPLRLGSVDIETASAPGGSVKLRASQVVDAYLTSVSVPPSTLISVPEPRQVVLLTGGAALLWALSMRGVDRD